MGGRGRGRWKERERISSRLPDEHQAHGRAPSLNPEIVT